jgi:hypothetical protein
LLKKPQVLLPVLHEYVQEQRRGPGEKDRAESIACKGVEVLVEALVLAQPDDGLSQSLCVILVAIGFQSVHQEPVYVDPDRTPPVSLLGEPEAVQIVAGNGCNGLIRQTEPFVFERVYYALCPILLRDTGVQRPVRFGPKYTGTGLPSTRS